MLAAILIGSIATLINQPLMWLLLISSVAMFVGSAIVMIFTNRCPHCNRWTNMVAPSGYCPKCGGWNPFRMNEQPPNEGKNVAEQVAASDH